MNRIFTAASNDAHCLFCVTYFFADDFANACHVSMIVSGFSEIDAMPSSVSHCAKSG